MMAKSTEILGVVGKIPDKGFFCLGIVHVQTFLEDLVNVRRVDFIRRQYAAQVPNKYAGIPEVFTRFQKSLRDFQAGFFGETQHFPNVFVSSFAKLDIAVAGIRREGSTPSVTSASCSGKIDGMPDFFQKHLLFQHNVVGRRDNQAGVGLSAASLKAVYATQGAVLLRLGFANNLVIRQFRSLSNQVLVSGIGNDEEVLLPGK